MSAVRRLGRRFLRLVGLGPKSAVERGGPGFDGILEATYADIPDIVRFEVPIFRLHEAIHPFDFVEPADDRTLVEKYEHLIRSKSASVSLYVTDDRAAGFISWATYLNQGVLEAAVLTIAVDPAYRRRELATSMLRHMRRRLS